MVAVDAPGVTGGALNDDVARGEVDGAGVEFEVDFTAEDDDVVDRGGGVEAGSIGLHGAAVVEAIGHLFEELRGDLRLGFRQQREIRMMEPPTGD